MDLKYYYKYMDRCCICFENLNKKYTTECNHSFHFDCIKKWYLTKQNCPICRNRFRDEMFTKQNYKKLFMAVHMMLFGFQTLYTIKQVFF